MSVACNSNFGQINYFNVTAAVAKNFFIRILYTPFKFSVINFIISRRSWKLKIDYSVMNLTQGDFYDWNFSRRCNFVRVEQRRIFITGLAKWFFPVGNFARKTRRWRFIFQENRYWKTFYNSPAHSFACKILRRLPWTTQRRKNFIVLQNWLLVWTLQEKSSNRQIFNANRARSFYGFGKLFGGSIFLRLILFYVTALSLKILSVNHFLTLKPTRFITALAKKAAKIFSIIYSPKLTPTIFLMKFHIICDTISKIWK